MPPTPGKSKEMLKHGKVHGKPLTDAQKRLFRAIAHGWKPTKQGK